MSAGSLAINQLVGKRIGPGPFAGIVSLAFQAWVIALVADGNNLGRVLVVLNFVLAVLPMQMLPRLIGGGWTSSAAYLVIAFALRAAAALLLFVGDSRRWFAAGATNRG
jgi:hypothetical protein